MQLSITAHTARTILNERSISMDRLRRTGRVDISPGVFMTVTGKCCYTLVDLSDAGGDGIADLVDIQDRSLIPACQQDADGTTREDRKEADRKAAVVHRFLTA